MVDKLDIIDDYLRTLGVNKNIINYMRERRIYLNKYFEDILGKDFYMWSDEIHRKEFCQKFYNLNINTNSYSYNIFHLC